MATNADEVQEETLDTTVDDLRKAKEESESNPATEEPTPSDQGAQSEESPVEEEAKAEPEATLTTDPQEHDLDWYKKAYDNSTKEALRLKGKLEKATPEPPVTSVPEGAALTASELYIKQKQDEEIATAFKDVTDKYPQVKDPEDYKKFTAMANTFGRTILDAEGRLATPKELYDKTVIALGWTADDSKEQLGTAIKDGAGSPRISSGTAQGPDTSKVTQAMISANRKMYPDKTDAQIREELEDYVQT